MQIRARQFQQKQIRHTIACRSNRSVLRPSGVISGPVELPTEDPWRPGAAS
jgi:hypothetical protein